MQLQYRRLCLILALAAALPVGGVHPVREVFDYAPPQVKNLDLGDKSELKKLAQQKEDAGELSAADERKYRQLRRTTERELLQVSLSHALT